MATILRRPTIITRLYTRNFHLKILFSHKGTKSTKKMIESRKISTYLLSLWSLCLCVNIFIPLCEPQEHECFILFILILIQKAVGLHPIVIIDLAEVSAARIRKDDYNIFVFFHFTGNLNGCPY